MTTEKNFIQRFVIDNNNNDNDNNNDNNNDNKNGFERFYDFYNENWLNTRKPGYLTFNKCFNCESNGGRYENNTCITKRGTESSIEL
jgi:hypothetical protein